MRAPLEGGLDAERDERLLARWLGLRGLFGWLRGILHDEEPGDADLYRHHITANAGNDAASLGEELERVVPSLEEVLRSWQRDPERVHRADNEVRRFARLAGESLESDGERVQLEIFLKHWETIIVGLGVRA